MSLWLQDHEVGFFGGVRWGVRQELSAEDCVRCFGTLHNLIGLKPFSSNQSQSAVGHLRLSA